MLSLSVASYHLCVNSTRASVVDVTAIPPKCLLSMVSQTISFTYFIIIDSKTFAAIGVIYIGLMSVLTYISGFVFGKGIMLADFHTVGRTPSRNEQLNILVSGATRELACSFNTTQGCCQGG